MANKANILAQYDKQHKKYKRFANEVEHQLRSILEEEGIVCNAITSRVKERDSLDRKIDIKMDKYNDLSEITDIASIRVITYYDNDVDRVAKIVEREFCVDKENSIDKREALDPEKFGYCSVHYVVTMNETRLQLPECKAYAGIKCEIQIRTVLQHAWAEIEHDLGYKNEIAVPRDIRRSFSRLAGLLEVADKEFQEIRDFLAEYPQKIQAEMKSDPSELSDCELDAVVLETFINTSKTVQKLNQKISEIAGMEICNSESQEQYVRTLQELNFLQIHTIIQLNQRIEHNFDLAFFLADKFLHDRYMKEPEGATLTNTIGIYYACYAELLLNESDKDKLILFMEKNDIGTYTSQNAFAEKLLKYSREFTALQE
ncbi:MAG: hypothetical protein HDR05_07775 [Lachnospiraceae bacterium]|nr:hypothetical protein [Lachnospiraceae bacterium]